MALGDYAAATADLDAAIALAPTDANLIVLRAEAYLELDNIDLSLRDAQLALDLDDDLATAHYIVGLSELEEENYFQAVVDLTDAIELEPEYARAYAIRAHCHLGLGDPDRAFADAERALELDTELADAYLARSYVYVYRREWDDALADADHAVELAPDDKKVWATRGQIYLEGGDANQALDDFERALEIDPGWVDGAILRASALDELQRYEDAILVLQAVLEMSTDVNDVELSEALIADLKRIPPVEDGKRTWEDAYHQFSISYPAEWRQYVDPGEVTPILLMGPLDKDYRANIILSVFEVDFYLPPTKLAKLYGPSATSLPGYELVSEDIITIDGHAAVRRAFTWTALDSRLRDVPVTVVQVYALIDGRVIIITATTRTEGAEKYEPVFDDIINSLVLE
jgi:tetratricopeptide (TPR) repeat protein